VTINVLNPNNQPTPFNLAIYTASIQDNYPTGALITVVSVSSHLLEHNECIPHVIKITSQCLTSYAWDLIIYSPEVTLRGAWLIFSARIKELKKIRCPREKNSDECVKDHCAFHDQLSWETQLGQYPTYQAIPNAAESHTARNMNFIANTPIKNHVVITTESFRTYITFCNNYFYSVFVDILFF